MTAAVPRTSTTAVISLVFGIVAWIALPVIGALVAVVTGHLARSEIRREPGLIDGDGMAVAGLVLGWVQLVSIVVGMVVLIAFFGGMAWLAFLVN